MPLGSKSMDQDPNTPPWGSARLTYSRCLTKLWHELMPPWSWHLWSPGSWFTFKKHHTHGKDISDIATDIAYSAFAPPWTCLLWWSMIHSFMCLCMNLYMSIGIHVLHPPMNVSLLFVCSHSREHIWVPSKITWEWYLCVLHAQLKKKFPMGRYINDNNNSWALVVITIDEQ